MYKELSVNFQCIVQNLPSNSISIGKQVTSCFRSAETVVFRRIVTFEFRLLKWLSGELFRTTNFLFINADPRSKTSEEN